MNFFLNDKLKNYGVLTLKNPLCKEFLDVQEKFRKILIDLNGNKNYENDYKNLNEFFEIFRIIQKSTFASPQLQSNTSNSAITSSANENILLIGDIKIQCDSERETSIQMPKLVFPKSTTDELYQPRI